MRSLSQLFFLLGIILCLHFTFATAQTSECSTHADCNPISDPLAALGTCENEWWHPVPINVCYCRHGLWGPRCANIPAVSNLQFYSKPPEVWLGQWWTFEFDMAGGTEAFWNVVWVSNSNPTIALPVWDNLTSDAFWDGPLSIEVPIDSPLDAGRFEVRYGAGHSYTIPPLQSDEIRLHFFKRQNSWVRGATYPCYHPTQTPLTPITCGNGIQPCEVDICCTNDSYECIRKQDVAWCVGFDAPVEPITSRACNLIQCH